MLKKSGQSSIVHCAILVEPGVNIEELEVDIAIFLNIAAGDKLNQ